MLEYSPLKEKDAEIFSPQATGISTGSVYKDFALLKNGFVPCFDTNIMIIQITEYVCTSKELIINTFDSFSSLPGGMKVSILTSQEPLFVSNEPQLSIHNFISPDKKLNESKLFARESLCYFFGTPCMFYCMCCNY